MVLEGLSLLSNVYNLRDKVFHYSKSAVAEYVCENADHWPNVSTWQILDVLYDSEIDYRLIEWLIMEVEGVSLRMIGLEIKSHATERKAIMLDRMLHEANKGIRNSKT